MENKDVYKIDPEHEGLTINQLSEIPKYAAMPYFELIKLLPEHQRNEIIEKDLSNLKALEKFVNKILYYGISKNLTVKEAGESIDYLKREHLVQLEMRFDQFESLILNETDLEKNLVIIIQALELLVSDINPSPLDPNKESLIYYKEKLIGFILKLKTINNLSNSLPKEKPNKNVSSYLWQTYPDKELPELYSLMKDTYKLIDQQTNLEQFTAVFTGQDIENINPIKWLHSNRLLAYFLDSAFYGQDWQSIAGNGKLFINKKSKIITANDLSVAKKGYVDFGKPKDYEIIDLILKTIKKH